MKAADLVVLASAHGIDISHTVASETNTRGAARPRRRTELERASGLPVRETVEGKASRVVRPREWTHAETGIAAGGKRIGLHGALELRLQRMPWFAVQYSWAGDRDVYQELHRGLTLSALKIAEQQHWPWQIGMANGKRDYYIERLTELVLDEEGYKRAFTEAPGLYAIYMGVTPQTWSKPLFGFFLTVQERYQRWIELARGTIQAKLRTDELATG